MAKKNNTWQNKKKSKESSDEELELSKKIKRLEELKKLEEDSKQDEESSFDETEDNEKENSDELESIISKTSGSRRNSRQEVNPFLEVSDGSQPETRLETQVQDTPAATAPTRTETDNVQRYVANAPSYSSSSGYESARGSYDEAGYPKQIQVRDLQLDNPSSLSLSFQDTFQRPQVVKPWMDQMQTPGSSAMDVEQKKYEPMEPKKRKIW